MVLLVQLNESSFLVLVNLASLEELISSVLLDSFNSAQVLLGVCLHNHVTADKGRFLSSFLGFKVLMRSL